MAGAAPRVDSPPAVTSGPSTDAGQAPGSERNDFFGSDGFTGEDLLDIINPLHHLPLIGMLYREVTGDTISPGARIVGGGLLGGPVGFVSGMVNVGIEKGTGRSVGQHLKSAAGFGEDGGTSQARPEHAARAYAAGSRTAIPRDRDGVLSPAGHGNQSASLDRSPQAGQEPRHATVQSGAVARSLADPTAGNRQVERPAARPVVRYLWQTGPAGHPRGESATRGSDLG